MIDSIFTKAPKPGMIARLKVSQQPAATLATGLTKNEERLAELTGMGTDSTNKAKDARKVDAYLRIFSYLKGIITGTSRQGYTPQFSKVEVELIDPQKPSVRTEA